MLAVAAPCIAAAAIVRRRYDVNERLGLHLRSVYCGGYAQGITADMATKTPLNDED